MLRFIEQIFIAMIILFLQFSFGQERIITGKILGQNLKPFPGVEVIDNNYKVLDTTDMNGSFEFKYLSNMTKIKFIFPMTQEEVIEISNKCSHLELILLDEWTYDFVTIKQAERKKKRQRKETLKRLYSDAFKKNLFDKNNFCRSIKK